MKVLVTALCLLASIAAYARISEDTTKGNPTCPVQIEQFGRVFQTQQEGLGNFHAKYKNQSDKTIIGVKFGIEVMDAVGDFHPTIIGIDYAGKTGPSKSTHITGSVYEYRGDKPFPGERLCVVKVAFSDGTTWADSGTKECRLTYDNRK